MGIKGLSSFLNKPRRFTSSDDEVFRLRGNESIFITRPTTDLAGGIVLIDTPIVLHMFKSFSPQDNGWLISFANYIAGLRFSNVHLAFVFEGTAPIAKAETQQKRIDDKKKMSEKNETLLNDFDVFEKTGEISDSLEQERIRLEKMRKSPFDMKCLKDELERQKFNTFKIGKKEIKMMEELLDLFGITRIQAEGEAEQCCFSLSNNEHVIGVYTKDSDIHAYGTKTVITDLGLNSFTYTTNQMMQYCLNMDHESMLDFFILCGTDYNSKIDKIGPCNAFKHIQTHKCIENVLRELNITPPETFTFRESRKLFSQQHVEMKIPFNVLALNEEQFLVKCRQFFEKFDVSLDAERIRAIFNKLDSVHPALVIGQVD
jgi:5'-3' exonuclease